MDNLLEELLRWARRALAALWQGTKWLVVRWRETFQRQETWKGKALVGFGGLLALLLVCGFIANIVGGGTPAPTPSLPPTVQATAPEAPKEPTTAPVPSPTVPLEVSLGDEVHTDKWSVKISDVKRAAQLFRNNRRLEPKGQWLIVYGEIQNLTTDRVTIFSSDFRLTTPTLKGEIEPHADATGAAAFDAGVERTVTGFLGMGIDPGQSAPLVVAFDVPEIVEETSLRVVDAEMSVNLGAVGELAMLPTPPPTNTPVPTDTPLPTNTPAPTDTSVPTDTPGPTDTLIPTATLRPTSTPIPSATAIAGPVPRIIRVNKDAEYVDIQNVGSEPVNLRNWTLVSEKGNQRWTVPVDYNLAPGATVRVWARQGQNDANNLYSGFDTTIWNNQERDPAVLLDPSGNEASRYP